MWALLAGAASFQGGFTNSSIVPLVVGVVLGAVIIGGVVWLVRMALSSRRPPPDDPPAGAPPGPGDLA
jgi:hypothetical protein